jgi:hypothetical protein
MARKETVRTPTPRSVSGGSAALLCTWSTRGKVTPVSASTTVSVSASDVSAMEKSWCGPPWPGAGYASAKSGARCSASAPASESPAADARSSAREGRGTLVLSGLRAAAGQGRALTRTARDATRNMAGAECVCDPGSTRPPRRAPDAPRRATQTAHHQLERAIRGPAPEASFVSLRPDHLDIISGRHLSETFAMQEKQHAGGTSELGAPDDGSVTAPERAPTTRIHTCIPPRPTLYASRPAQSEPTFHSYDSEANSTGGARDSWCVYRSHLGTEHPHSFTVFNLLTLVSSSTSNLMSDMTSLPFSASCYRSVTTDPPPCRRAT